MSAYPYAFRLLKSDGFYSKYRRFSNIAPMHTLVFSLAIQEYSASYTFQERLSNFHIPSCMKKQILRFPKFVSKFFCDRRYFQLSITIPTPESRIFVSAPDSSSEIARKLMVHGVYQDQIRCPVHNRIDFPLLQFSVYTRFQNWRGTTARRDFSLFRYFWVAMHRTHLSFFCRKTFVKYQSWTWILVMRQPRLCYGLCGVVSFGVRS